MPARFADDAVVRLRQDTLAWRRVADDVVVLNTTSSNYHSINPSGSALWERLAEGASVAQLTATLAASFPDAADRAAGDVQAFLVQLDSRGLIELSPESTTTRGR